MLDHAPFWSWAGAAPIVSLAILYTVQIFILGFCVGQLWMT